MTKTLCTLLALTALSAPLFAGCANKAGDDGAVAGEIQHLTSTDQALKQELTTALAGLATGGGEGESDPYKVTTVTLAPGEQMTEDVLLARLLPTLIAGDDEMIPGLDETPIADAWGSNIEEPNAPNFEGDPEGLDAAKQDAAKWRAVKAIFDTKLTNVKYFNMGYRAYPDGSLETGAVAHVFVGVSSTGQLFAIWGIDIWT